MTPPSAARRQAARRAIDDLKRYRSSLTRQSFLGDGDAQRMVLHALYVATQACIDEATYLCARRGLPTEAYRATFLELARAGVLDAELAGRLADWASLRNVIAHFYPVVDPERVWQSLADLAVLETFLLRAGEVEP